MIAKSIRGWIGTVCLAVLIGCGGDGGGGAGGQMPTEPHPPPSGNDSWSAISAGHDHTCGLFGEQAYCWGAIGEAGGDTPNLMGGGHAWATISSGSSHSCGVTTTGEGYCWGVNLDGQLGDGNFPQESDVPSRVAGGHNWATIDAGDDHTCGVTEGGDGYCWGRSDAGQLGKRNQLSNPDTPIPVDGDHSWRVIRAGNTHTCGLATDGTAFCWGDNFAGQLGTGDRDDRLSPAPVVGDHIFNSISAGTEYTCGVTSDNDAYCWGANPVGQLGDGTQDVMEFGRSETPIRVVGGVEWEVVSTSNFSHVQSDDEHTCGVAVDGLAYCWGGNKYGAFGAGEAQNQSSSPVLVLTEQEWSTINAGEDHTCGITTEGDAYCWGRNGSGQIGDGSSGNFRDVPVPVVSPQ